MSPQLKKKEEIKINIPENVIKSIIKKLTNFETSNKFIKKKYTLNTLAKEFNTNSSYLSSIINSTKDANFSSYLNNLRIDYAIDKLKKDKKFRIYTIKAIAEEVGFNTSQSFTNAFYKKTRLYPSFFIAKIKKM
jgi:AraC-like DNA-binding protein